MNEFVFADAVRVLQRKKHVFKGIELKVSAAPIPQPHFLPSPNPDQDSSPDKDSTQSYTPQLQGANTADLEASYETFHDAITSFREDSPKSDDLTHRSAQSIETEMKGDLSGEGISGDQNKHLKASHRASVYDKAPQEKKIPAIMEDLDPWILIKVVEGTNDQVLLVLSSFEVALKEIMVLNKDTRSFGTPDQSPIGHKELGHHDKSPIVSPYHDTASYPTRHYTRHYTHGDRNWHDHPARGHYEDYRVHYHPHDLTRSLIVAHDRGTGDYHDRGSTHRYSDRRIYSDSRDPIGPQERRSFDPHSKGRDYYGGSPAWGQYEHEPPDHGRYPRERSPGMYDRNPRGFSERSDPHRTPADYYNDRHDHQGPVHEASPGRYREDYPSSSKVPASAKMPGPVKGQGYARVPEPSETEEPEKEGPCIIVVGNVLPGASSEVLTSFLEHKRYTNVEEVQAVELKGKKAVVTLSKASGE